MRRAAVYFYSLVLLFHHPERLWALALLLPLTGLVLSAWHWEAARRVALGDARLIPGLWTDGRVQNGRTRTRAFLLLGALLCGIVGWAGPFTPKGGVIQQTGSSDVLIALDASRSMRATDLQPDRLHRAVAFINRLTDRLPGDRVGLIVFAGRAYLQVPLTTDRAAFRLALSAVRPETLPAQGTVLSSALNLAVASFSQKERRAKALVLVTDGEDHDNAASDAVQQATKAGIVVHAVGVGDPAGAPLYEAPGQPKVDADGVPVVTKLDEGGLQQLVKRGGGRYVRLRDAATAAASIAAAVRSRGVVVPDAESTNSRREYFPLALGAALALLLLSRIRTTVARLPRTAILLVLLAGSGSTGWAQKAYLREGDARYRTGRFSEAAAAYRKALGDSATRAIAQYNLGNALYRMQRYDAAQQAYEAAAGPAALRSTTHYNEGNARASQQQWREAAEAYKKALRAAPGAADAQYNLSYALKHLSKEKENEKKQPQQPPKQQPQPQQQSGQKPDPAALSKAQAERLLQALRNEERRILDRQKATNAEEAQPEKDW